MEYEVKAAFLYNFAVFVEWPPHAFARQDSPLRMCLVGRDPFGSALDRALAGKAIHGRSFEVRRLPWGPHLKSCHILFVSASETATMHEHAALWENYPILTIGEAPGFAENGGIINFAVAGDKIHFEINVASARRVSLQLSAKLLALARIIEK